MKNRVVSTFTVTLLILQFCCNLWALPVTKQQAEKVVKGWSKANVRPLGVAISQQITKIESFPAPPDQPLYYVVHIAPSGFVIVSADDMIEPIIAFADDGTYDPSLNNPLGALVTNDLNGRIAAVRQPQQIKSTALWQSADSAQNKWRQLENLGGQSEEKLMIMGLGDVSDIWVNPLIQSKWGQESVCGNYCYNYYTPNHYPSGCFATAIAQLIKFYEHPSYGIGVHSLEIFVNEVPQWKNTRGGNGAGGSYNWNLMELTPDCSTTLAQRQSVGALCYDVGLATKTHYTSSGSAIYLDQLDAIGNNLKNIFGYSNGKFGCNGCAQGNLYNIGAGLNGMVNPNLDSGNPVVLTIHHISGGFGHAILCDGYGYNFSTLYHHLNMGWDGIDDAWYNLPTINSSPSYNTINGCIYNIYISGSGEIISGRVTNTSGSAISGATVTAQKSDGG